MRRFPRTRGVWPAPSGVGLNLTTDAVKLSIYPYCQFASSIPETVNITARGFCSLRSKGIPILHSLQVGQCL